MSYQWSLAENDEVWVDDLDSMVWCDECDAEFDAAAEGSMSEGYPLCDECYDESFAE